MMNFNHLAFATLLVLAFSFSGSASVGAQSAAAERALSCPHCSDDPVSLVGTHVELLMGRDVLEQQYRAFTSMGRVKVTYGRNGVPVSIDGDVGIVLGTEILSRRVGDDASDLLTSIGDLMFAVRDETLTIERIDLGLAKTGLMALRQSIHGIPVDRGWIHVRFDLKTHRIVSIEADFLPNRGLPRLPKLRAADALRRLADELTQESTGTVGIELTIDGSPTLMYGSGVRQQGTDVRPRLMWVVPFFATDGLGDRVAYIDATDGSLLMIVHTAWRAVNRIVGTAENEGMPDTDLPGVIVLSEGQSSADITAMRTYTNVGTTYNAFLSGLQWRSLDNADSPIRVTVHYCGENNQQCPNWPNAEYKRRNGGKQYLMFGDGALNSMMPFGEALDVVGHEFMHAVIDNTASYDPQDPHAGAALTEGMADLGAVIADYSINVGPRIWSNGNVYLSSSDRGMRYWDIPKRENTAYRDWWPHASSTPVALGGHYLNSTILGHAVHLLSRGGLHARAGSQGIPSINVPNIGFVKARRISLKR